MYAVLRETCMMLPLFYVVSLFECQGKDSDFALDQPVDTGVESKENKGQSQQEAKNSLQKAADGMPVGKEQTNASR